MSSERWWKSRIAQLWHRHEELAGDSGRRGGVWRGLLALCNPLVRQARGGVECSEGCSLGGIPLSTLVDHHLAPLAYWCWKESACRSLDGPSERFLRDLRAAYVQARHANRVRFSDLEEIVAAGSKRGLEFRVLKGSALAHLVYPDPALRPMRDLDLLVSSAQLQPIADLLVELGFGERSAPAESAVKHLPPFCREREGVVSAVELHYDLFDGFWQPSYRWEDLEPDGIDFSVGSTVARALSPLRLLWHSWRHLLEEERLRLIWVADLVACAETFFDQLDWDRLRTENQGLVTLLELLAPAIPLSDRLRGRLKRHSYFPATPSSLQLAGWPRTGPADWYGREVEFFHRSFWPSRGWLAIRYGELGRWDRVLNRVVRHPAQLLRWVSQRIKIRLRKSRKAGRRQSRWTMPA